MSAFAYALFAAALFAGGVWTAIILCRRFFLDGFSRALDLRLPTVKDEIDQLRAERRARFVAEEEAARRTPEETPAEMVARMLGESNREPQDPDNPLGPVPPMPGEARRR